MTPEAKTKQRIKKILEDAGVWFFMPPANGYGRSGIPDFICCVNGFFFAIEAKAGKGQTTALQERELERIRKANGSAIIVWDIETDYLVLQNRITYMKGLPHD